jgi:hypothetical protein
LNIGTDGCSGLLGEINIAKHQLRFRERTGEKESRDFKHKIDKHYRDQQVDGDFKSKIENR